ncbi:uncharacterized membrane protein HdeD (DUF308 family) [Natronospira proteinivora]|uniref:Uncharacterized membrane protein HdeD (DUF308 family) n=1 Tax=Natronospira proteinivora TaxID=1807133 RepID=A0ABT1G5S4_9GAMM|nr:DUF3096 domain-containing protein [Natronospira proteinivora]MCP1726645.1 uncharacterized membrane protein HdeD (DUF308 family) [Natronospira proteinivora]
MNIDVNLLLGLLAIIAGILILVKPKLLNYVVAIFLLVYGVLKILPYVT